MDVATLAIIGAGSLILGGSVVMLVKARRRPEDHLALYFADLERLSTASGVSPQRPRRAACEKTLDDHQSDSGTHSIVESSGSPPPIHGSDHGLPVDPMTGGAADVQPIPPVGGPVLFNHPVWRRDHVLSCPVCRKSSEGDRPALLLVKS